jgi:hypothetical protein
MYMQNLRFLSCPFKILAFAVELTLEKDFKGASAFIKIARDMASPEQLEDVAYLAMCVTCELAKAQLGSTTHEKNKHTEFATVQYWFKNNIEFVISGGVLKNDVTNYRGDYRPDFYVIVDGEKRPVECKKTFNERAVNQLNCYMKKTGASIGYAVAFKLKCKLPPNMIFIECPIDVLAQLQIK